MKNNVAAGELTIRRAVFEQDSLFLQQLYVDRRSPDLGSAGWQEVEVISFLQSQFELRNRAYRMRYPGAEYRVIEIGGTPVGEIIVFGSNDGLRLVDLSVLPADRTRGIGSGVIERLQSEASEAGVSIILHVDKANHPAKRLYKKLGFRSTNEDQISIEMTWP